MNVLLNNFDPISLEQMSSVKLMNRTDTKFVTNTLKLCQLLEMAQDDYYVQEIDGERNLEYDTTYFDTMAFDMYNQHQWNHTNRQKIRFRTYCVSGLQFMEVKTKNNHRPEKTVERWDFDDEAWEDKVRSAKGKNQLRSRFEISYDRKRAFFTPFAGIELYNNDGTLDISVTADAARGIKSDSVVVITGGATTITTTGDCLYDSDEQDYSSAACIKCDYDFTMSGGTLTMTSSGDGGKGINTSAGVLFSGGTLSAVTTGGNEEGKPKAVKAVTGITISGGSFYAKVSKSWACDSGYGDDTTTDDDRLANCVTVIGTPATNSIAKKQVQIIY